MEALAAARYVGTEPVELRRLEDLVTLRPGERIFLKLDVQGFEERALDGATGLLPSVAMIQIELSLSPNYEGQPGWMELLARLNGLGFSPFMLVPAFSHPQTGQTLQVDAVLLRN